MISGHLNSKCIYCICFQKYGYPQIIHFNRVWNHYFHHPFWVLKSPYFLETSIYHRYIHTHPLIGWHFFRSLKKKRLHGFTVPSEGGGLQRLYHFYGGPGLQMELRLGGACGFGWIEKCLAFFFGVIKWHIWKIWKCDKCQEVFFFGELRESPCKSKFFTFFFKQ